MESSVSIRSRHDYHETWVTITWPIPGHRISKDGAYHRTSDIEDIISHRRPPKFATNGAGPDYGHTKLGLRIGI